MVVWLSIWLWSAWVQVPRMADRNDCCCVVCKRATSEHMVNLSVNWPNSGLFNEQAQVWINSLKIFQAQNLEYPIFVSLPLIILSLL